MRISRLLVLLSLLFILIPAQAGDYVLTNNSGSGSATFFISGEPTLIMNGFDLNGRGLNLPVSIDRVRLDVVTPVPNEAVDVVIYQDADGGSPVNATLVRRASVNITQAGVYTLDLTADPVQITQPVVWIGFYLPVNFEFRADTSGNSVLTYWAWTPGGRFDVANLASASVLGPGDGSAPVSISMGGVARITAELITDGTVPAATTTAPTPVATTTTSSSVPVGRVGRDKEIFNTVVPPVVRDTVGNIIQAQGGNADLTFVLEYPDEGQTGCDGLYYDSYDVKITYKDFVDFFCKSVGVALAPGNPMGYFRQGALYDVYAFQIDQGLNPWPENVTHCLYVPTADLNRAVIGLAQGSPRVWTILPSVRFGDVVCAEIRYSGFVSYFLPA
ncbi:MAG: hypothetical protein OHK0046_06570 [Anaerolineae bacterium]